MTSFLKNIFGSHMKKSPSMDDFSMGAKDQAEDQLDKPHVPQEVQKAAEDLHRTSGPTSPTRTDTWQSVFNPGRNFNRTSVGRSNYDYVDDKKKAPTTWEMILRADEIKHLTFAGMDKDADGYIGAEDLRHHLGSQEHVAQLIKQADKNNDGKIDIHEFSELMRSIPLHSSQN